jgi:hypothetical protein
MPIGSTQIKAHASNGKASVAGAGQRGAGANQRAITKTHAAALKAPAPNMLALSAAGASGWVACEPAMTSAQYANAASETVQRHS